MYIVVQVIIVELKNIKKDKTLNTYNILIK